MEWVLNILSTQDKLGVRVLKHFLREFFIGLIVGILVSRGINYPSFIVQVHGLWGGHQFDTACAPSLLSTGEGERFLRILCYHHLEG